MTPIYLDPPVADPWPTNLARFLAEVPWLHVAETRAECFMAAEAVSYTYGRGRGERTYTSTPFLAGVDEIMARINAMFAPRTASCEGLNVCFLNRYDGERQHLGWHADDHAGTDHAVPIVVVSFGEARAIQWRARPSETFVAEQDRAACTQILEDGSIFAMPAGFQFGHQHRIPKGGRKMGPRVSLTFRAFLPPESP